MRATMIMVRYGELSTKGKNINDFIELLGQNIKKALSHFMGIRVHWQRDRTYVHLNGHDADDVIAVLKDIFGIANMSPVVSVPKDLKAAERAAVALVQPYVSPGQTFKIQTRRADHDFQYDTMQMNRKLGDAVGSAYPELGVRMDDPNITVHVEIRQKAIYLYTDIIQGLGGMPVGSAGKGMLMLSGGIDSPVAGYLAMKRGMDIEAVHFASPPYTSDQALQKAKDLAAKLSRYGGSITFIEVPFTEIQEDIKREIPEGYVMTITRRMMMRLVDKIRQMRGGLAIINGESIGQVASQTLESMVAINAVTTTPVLRPVVAMDKTEIIEIAKAIDTYELSILPFEDCCTIFTPQRPKTKPTIEHSEKFEENLEIDELIRRALEDIKIETISESNNGEAENDFSDLL